MSDAYRPPTGLWRVSRSALAALTAAVLVLALAVGSARLAPDEHSLATPAVQAIAARAENTMRTAERVLAEARRVEGVPTPAEAGPAASALIGDELTPLVTTLGSLEAKHLAADPRWASALAVRLANRGIGPGAVVAAGFSGSFPGLNLAVAAACQALGAELLAISSVTASTWGANQPGFTWPEIERRLIGAGVLRPVSMAVTMGGAGDRGLDLEEDGRRLAAGIMVEAARALRVPTLVPDSYQAAVEERLALYDRGRRGRPVALYVNVGGTEASLGRSPVVLRQGNGFLPAVPFDLSPYRGVTARFAEKGVRILMLLNVRELAVRWGIPLGGAKHAGGPTT